MADRGRSPGLQTIFSVFLGLMVTAFLGVGAYTFYPPPQKEMDRQIRDLGRREELIRDSRSPAALSAEDRVRIRELNEERNKLGDASRAAREDWGRGMSIILIALATLVMAVSLVRSDQLRVISNGLLMGGVFTMIYGVGWIIATDTTVARFVVMTVALVITLALGYGRFVRGRGKAVESGGPAIAEEGGLSDIDRRVRDLEIRMNEAASALSQKREQ